MPDTLDQSVVSGVANANFKVIAEATTAGIAQAGSLAAQNAVSHQQAKNMIQEAFLAEALLPRAGVDPTEAGGVKKVVETDLNRTLGELGATLSAIQQQLKAAQSSLPETGQGS